MIGTRLRWFLLAALLASPAFAQRGGVTGTPVPSGTACAAVVVSSDPLNLPCSDCSVYFYSVTGKSYCCTNSVRTVCGTGAATGTVTSVALSVPAEFSVIGSPITGSGTFVISEATQTANTVYAGPTTGSAAAPGFRALVAADIPTITRTESKGIVLDAPTTSEDVTIWRTPVNITITALHCVLVGGTSLQYTIRYHTDRNNAGSQVVNGGTLCGSTTTGTANSGLSVAVAAGNWIWLETATGGSGTVNNFAATITYTVP